MFIQLNPCKDGLVLRAVHYTGTDFSTSVVSRNWTYGMDCTRLKPCDVVLMEFIYLLGSRRCFKWRVMIHAIVLSYRD